VKRTVVAATLVALIIGIAAGYYWRRVRHPTLEERTEDAAKQLQKSLHELTK
jgi:hypothetical protein